MIRFVSLSSDLVVLGLFLGEDINLNIDASMNFRLSSIIVHANHIHPEVLVFTESKLWLRHLLLEPVVVIVFSELKRSIRLCNVIEQWLQIDFSLSDNLVGREEVLIKRLDGQNCVFRVDFRVLVIKQNSIVERGLSILVAEMRIGLLVLLRVEEETNENV